MQRISRGRGFKGALRYALDREPGQEAGKFIGGNMASDTPDRIANEFRQSANQRPDIEKPVWHNALRLPAGEKLSVDQWNTIAEDYMRRMGFTDLHQRAIVLHDDPQGQHIHIVASRVALDGSVYLGQNENLRSTDVIARLERTHGLRATKPAARDASGRAVMPDQAAPKKAEVERALRTGERPARMELQDRIDAAAAGRPTTAAFIERLQAAGVTVRPNVASTGRMNGFSFEIAGVSFKASQLGKAYAWQALQERIDYEQARDGPILAECAGRAAGIARADGGQVAAPGSQPAAADDRLADAAARPARSAAAADRGVAGQPGPGWGPGSRGATPGDPGSHGRSGAAQGRTGAAGQGAQAATAGAAVAAGARVAAGGNGGGAGGAVVRIAELGAPALAPDHAAKVEAWRRQAAALGAPAWRLTLMSRRPELTTYNHGKGRDGGPERFYSAAEVEKLIPQLRRQNARGYDVYVTPIDPEHHYLVVDDMRDAGQALRAAGWTPALVQTSSPGNWQAIVKAPKQPGPDEQGMANGLVQQLNQSHGDPKFSGVVHPFRMAGFSNRKAGRGDAFTRLVEAGGRLCQRAAEWLQRRRDQIAQQAEQRQRAEADEARRRGAFDDAIERDQQRAAGPHEVDLSEVFEAERQAVQKTVQARGWPLDLSRVDYAVARRMARGGWTTEQISRAILIASPYLVDRHRRPREYADMTAQKAAGQYHPAPPPMPAPSDDQASAGAAPQQPTASPQADGAEPMRPQPK